jgi:Putative transposase
LHTWPQTLRLHPHLHVLVAGGGLTPTGHWVAVHTGFLLPSRVVMALCRGKRLAALRRALREGQLQLPAGMRLQRCENLLNKLCRAKWNVHIWERYPHGAGVLTYLARYLRGGPLANRRLVSYAQGEVTFRYRVNGEADDRPRRGLMTWPMAEFIGRYLRHVPAPGTRVVRAYGLYAPTQGEALTGARAQLEQGPVAARVILDGQTACSQRGADHPERCPVCGRLLVCRGVLPRASGPPAVAVLGVSVA